VRLTYFIDSLNENTIKTVTFKRCANLAEATSAATSYEDVFYPTYEDYKLNKSTRSQDRRFEDKNNFQRSSSNSFLI